MPNWAIRRVKELAMTQEMKTSKFFIRKREDILFSDPDHETRVNWNKDDQDDLNLNDPDLDTNQLLVETNDIARTGVQEEEKEEIVIRVVIIVIQKVKIFIQKTKMIIQKMKNS